MRLSQEIDPGVTVRFVTGRFAGRLGTVLAAVLAIGFRSNFATP